MSVLIVPPKAIIPSRKFQPGRPRAKQLRIKFIANAIANATTQRCQIRFISTDYTFQWKHGDVTVVIYRNTRRNVRRSFYLEFHGQIETRWYTRTFIRLATSVCIIQAEANSDKYFRHNLVDKNQSVNSQTSLSPVNPSRDKEKSCPYLGVYPVYLHSRFPFKVSDYQEFRFTRQRDSRRTFSTNESNDFL